MIILYVSLTTIAFSILGYGPTCLLVKECLERHENSRVRIALYLAPTLGATILGFVAQAGQFIVSQMLWSTVIGMVSVLAIWTAVEFRRDWLKIKSLLPTGLPLLFALSTVVALPFVYHLAPPDVDAMAFGYFSFLMKSGLGFPQATPWLEKYAEVMILASDANSALAVVLSTLTGIDLAQSVMTTTCFWLLATLLIALVFVEEFFGKLLEAGQIVPYLAVGLVFNRATIWEYGDGSYARVAATAIIFFIAFLLAFRGKAASKDTTPLNSDFAFSIVIGFLHTAILYFHYRFFVWHSLILAVWLIGEVATQKRFQAWKNLALVLIGSTIALVPMILTVLRNPDALAKRTVSPEFAAKHETAGDVLWQMFMRFNGWVLPICVLVGFAIVILRRRRTSYEYRPLFRLASIHLLVMAFFCFDDVVLLVAPWSYNLLYSQTAIISNFAFPKFIFGFVSLAALYWWIEGSLRGSLSKRIAVLAISGLLSLVAWEIAREIEVKLPVFDFQFSVHGTEIWYAMGVLLAGIVTLIFTCFGRVRFATGLLITLTFGVLANEWTTARFNYPYIAPGDVEVFRWLQKNTEFDETLVLNYSALDIDHEAETRHFADFAGLATRYAVADYRTHWLSVISERASIFHRGNLVSRFAGGSFVVLSGQAPQLEQLDHAYFGLPDPDACATIKVAGITHVYVPADLRAIMNLDAPNTCLTLVFESRDLRNILLESPPMQNGFGPAIYAVRK